MKLTSIIIAAAIIAILVISAVLSRFHVDLLWFGTLGYESVFRTVLLAEISVFFVAASVSALLLAANGLVALRKISTGFRRPRSFRVVGRGWGAVPEVIELSLEKLPWRMIFRAARPPNLGQRL